MARPIPAWAPPLRDGVSASRVAAGAGPWTTVLEFLRARFPAVADWPERLVQGDVLAANGQAMAADSPCPPGTLLWYWRQPPPEPRVPFELDLLHQCEHLVVVDKPHFLPVTPAGRHLMETVLVRLRQQLGIDTLTPMHRLDRDTAGVLAFMVQPATRAAYQALLRQRQVHKVYEAVAAWRADVALPFTCRSRLQAPAGAGFMQMRTVPGEPNAQTLIELIQRIRTPDAAQGEFARYRLTPTTGQTHQLRVQMCDLGLPLVGDRIYPQLLPDLPPGAVPDYSQPLQLLARELAFTDPITRQPRRFVSQRQLLWAPVSRAE